MKTLKNFFQREIVSKKKLSIFALLLLPAAFFYFLAYFMARLSFRFKFSKTLSLPVPVISIGNLTVGGTGKTPFVIYLSRKIEHLGKQPVVLMRGYGEDETHLLNEKIPDVPVLIGKDRFQNAKKYLKEKNKADFFILDDGFQHWRLDRELDILLVNALNPFGNGLLLPAGILREPKSAIRRAQAVILTHTNKIPAKVKEKLRAYLIKMKPRLPILEANFEPVSVLKSGSQQEESPEILDGRKVIAFCGIGYPQGFEASLRELGADIVDFISYSDHEPYTEDHVLQISRRRSKSPDAVLITTEKDYCRQPSLLRQKLQVWVLKIELKVTQGEKSIDDVLSRLSDY